MTGPLAGIRVVELAAIGPAPFAGMMLADLGADVITIDRASHCLGSAPESVKGNIYGRGRRSIGVDLKHPEGPGVVAALCDTADVFVEGFRPGVAERLGVGPDDLCGRNPRLVYARMTGWGREGPLAPRAGHDLNYIGLAGPLAHIGRVDQLPTVPLQLVGDFGGGGMFLAFGICAALVERATSGRGQVVDAAIVDGAALLNSALFAAHEAGVWNPGRATNGLDGGAHFYDCYACADGEILAVAAIEAPFYTQLLEGLGLSDLDLPDQGDESRWPEMKELFTERIGTRTRQEWLEVFAGTDACVSAVLTMDEAPDDPHLRERGTYVTVDGVRQPGTGPRFSRTEPVLDRPPAAPGFHTDELLTEAGYDSTGIAALRTSGAVA